jgi:glucan phosphoethanolaminetransferase (alkaline phosphatase superfamily)
VKIRWMIACAVAAVLTAAALLALRSPGGPPNVLLVTIDTLRADHLHCYGQPLPTSPNIDAFAARSVVFERAIAASGYTGPAHSSIMTARYPRRHSFATNAASIAWHTAPLVALHLHLRKSAVSHGSDNDPICK